MTEYITIPVFADQAGVTRQAVYKRIDKDLQTFVKVVDGRKLLHTNALTLFKQTEQATTADQQTSNQSTDMASKLLADQVNQLSNQLAISVDMLQASQLENRKLTDQLITLSADFSALAKQSNTLLSQSQSLQGHMQERTLGKPVVDNETTVDIKGNQPEETVDTKAVAPRGNWFTRRFK